MVYHAKANHHVQVLNCKDLDAANMVKLKGRINRMLRQNRKHLLLDLSRTRHIDLAGLGILVERLRKLRSVRGELKFCNLRSHVSEVLKLVGVNNLIESYGSRQEALQSFVL